MSLTRRFGLHKFGTTGGDLSEDGFAYSSRDRDTIDSLLAAYESHTHAGGVKLADPTEVPVLALDTSAGEIPSGVTYYYRVGFVDAYGLETAGSDEVSVSTPVGILAPPPPAVVGTTGGTLAGVYYYAVSFTQGALETLASPVSLLTVEGGSTAVVIQLPTLPAGALGWNLYRQGPMDGDLYLLARLQASNGTTYTDNGSVAAGTATLPYVDTTNSTNTITVTCPDVSVVTADPSPVKSWRLYRTTVAGDYGGISLVHEVVETVNQSQPFGGLVTSWADSGASLFEGAPQPVSQTLTPGPVISGGMPPAGTAGQVLSKVDSALFNVAWETLPAPPAGLPVGGAAGQALQKIDATDGNAAWANVFDDPFPSVLLVAGTVPASPAAGRQRLFIDSADNLLKRVSSAGTVTTVGGGTPAGLLPTGGATGQMLVKLDGSDFNTQWTDATVGRMPVGGTIGQVLSKISGTDYAAQWIDAPINHVPVGGTAGQVLSKVDATDYNLAWVPAAGGVAGPGVAAGGTAGQVLSKVDGTDYNTAWATPAAGASFTRTTASHVTAVLALGASESSTIAMAIGYRLLRISTDRAARVRLYATAAQQTADLGRAVGVDPTGNHGLMFEFVTTAGLLTTDLSPLVDGASMEVSPTSAIPLTVENNAASAAVTVTLTYLRTE